MLTLCLSLIRFRGHLPKAGYDGTHGIKQGWPPVHVAHDRVVQLLQQAEEVFTKRQRLGEDVIAFAFALKSRALARLGELLADLAKAKGGTPYKSTRSNSEQVERTATLTDLGIDRKTSMVAQQLAALPLATREAIAQREVTLSQAKREVKAVDVTQRVSLPDAKYRVLCADPPWSYHDKADAGAVQAGGAWGRGPLTAPIVSSA